MSAEAASDYKPPLVLPVDIGSASVKASLYDAAAQLVEGTAVLAPHSRGVLQKMNDEQPDYVDIYGPNPKRASRYLNGLEA